jgi:hypothetical protein
VYPFSQTNWELDKLLILIDFQKMLPVGLVVAKLSVALHDLVNSTKGNVG